MDTQKLFADVRALLQSAGMGQIALRESQHGTLLSAETQDGTGVVFYVTPSIKNKESRTKSVAGGRVPQPATVEATLVPSSVALEEQMKTDPAAAAELLGMSVEAVRRIVAPAEPVAPVAHGG
jgi:hypothetical protein